MISQITKKRCQRCGTKATSLFEVPGGSLVCVECRPIVMEKLSIIDKINPGLLWFLAMMLCVSITYGAYLIISFGNGG
jgi:hypothetical protein